MATLSTATSNFSNTVTALVLRKIVSELRNKLAYLQEGSYTRAEIIPGTNLLRYIAYRDMTATVNAGTITPGTQPWLTEGVAPTAEALAISYEEFAAGQAGRLLAITDLALRESPHRLFEVAAEKIARDAAETLDLLIATRVHAGTDRVIYGGAATSRVTVAATHIITGATVRKVVATLKAANVPTFPDGTYHAIINPLVSYDLLTDTSGGGWVDASRYAKPENLLQGEVGQYAGVRFYESNVGNNFVNAGVGSTVDVYSTIFFGPEYFAIGDLQAIEAYMVNPGGDHSDPLAQQALVGWKGTFNAKVLTTAGTRANYLRLEAASSIGAN